MKQTLISVVTASLLNCVLATTVLAQPFPARPIKLVVPYPPGAVTDILGRTLAQALGDPLG